MKNLLALDIATKTGWATSTSSGVWNLTPKRNESKGMRLISFKGKLKMIFDVEEIDLVVYEMPAGRHKASIIVAAEMIGVMKIMCDERNIDYRPYTAPEIKKFATGKGNCGKPAMIKSAKERYNIDVVDDNEADALHLYHLAKEDLNL